MLFIRKIIKSAFVLDSVVVAVTIQVRRKMTHPIGIGPHRGVLYYRNCFSLARQSSLPFSWKVARKEYLLHVLHYALVQVSIF